MAEGNLKYSGQLLKIMGLIEAKTTSTTGITPYVFPGKKKTKMFSFALRVFLLS